MRSKFKTAVLSAMVCSSGETAPANATVYEVAEAAMQVDASNAANLFRNVAVLGELSRKTGAPGWRTSSARTPTAKRIAFGPCRKPKANIFMNSLFDPTTAYQWPAWNDEVNETSIDGLVRPPCLA
jgi:hypothetical protein